MARAHLMGDDAAAVRTRPDGTSSESEYGVTAKPPRCGAQLHYENMVGILVYRTGDDGEKLYRYRCPACKRSGEVQRVQLLCPHERRGPRAPKDEATSRRIEASCRKDEAVELTVKQIRALETCEWAQKHFSGASTGRRFTLRIAKRLQEKGLIDSPGLAEPCDDDGFIVAGRTRPYWVLTDAGRRALADHRARHASREATAS